MNMFTEWFNRLMVHEGGYVNNPKDPGGETMYGITKRVAVAHGYNGRMRDLPKSTAQAIAEKSYYNAVSGGVFDPMISWQLTDAAYNHGNRQAVKFLQRACGANADGIIGPRTIKAVEAMDKNDVVLLFLAERLEFFTRLSTWLTFGRGWARRVATNLRFAAKDN